MIISPLLVDDIGKMCLKICLASISLLIGSLRYIYYRLLSTESLDIYQNTSVTF